MLRNSLIIVILISLLLNRLEAQTLSRSSLGLKGCSVSALATTDGGSLSLAGCEGPKGLYFSQDFGDSWSFAIGGDYDAGSATWVGFASSKAYALIENVLYKASLPSSGTWVPSWQEVKTDFHTNSPQITGERYILATFGNRIVVLDTQTDTELSEISAPSGYVASRIATNGTYLYVVGTPEGSQESPRYLFRASYNKNTGAVSSSWEDVSTTALPQGTDLTSANIWSIFGDEGSGRAVMSIRFQGAENEDKVYVSVDGVLFEENHGGEDFGMGTINFACIAGDTMILGSRFSLDGGVNIGGLPQSVTNGVQGDVRIEDKGCALVKDNPTSALISTNQGVARTTTLNLGGNSTWASVINGMESVQVVKITRSTENPDRVLLGTTSGVAITDNYSSETPSWKFPICPGWDCVGGRQAVLDPNNDSVFFYGSGNIRKCTITGIGDTAQVNCDDLASKPHEFFFYSSFDIFNFSTLANRIYSAYFRSEGAVDGGLYYYDIQSGDETEAQDPLLKGVPLNRFFAVNDLVHIVARGTGSINDINSRDVVLSNDGGLTWSILNEGDSISGRLVSDFAYDSVRDIIYAATEQNNLSAGGTPQEQNGAIYRIESATHGGRAWIKGGATFSAPGRPDNQPVSFSSLDIDQATGIIFAASREEIWASADKGATWQLYFKGLPDESTSQLEVEQDVNEMSGDIRKNAISRIAQGSNTGLYTLPVVLNTPVATPTPTLLRAQCRLTVQAACKRKVKKGKQCTFIVKLKRNGKGLKRVKYGISRRSKSSEEWKQVGKEHKTTNKGSGNISLRVAKTYMFKIASSQYACTSNVVRVKVKK